MKTRGLFFYILIFLALAVIAVLVFVLAPSRDVPTAPVVMPSPTASEDPYSRPGDRRGSEIVITPETVQTAISTLSRAESYSRTLKVSTFWSGGSMSRSISVWKNRKNIRISERGDGLPGRDVIIRGSEKWIWYSDFGDIFHGEVRDGDEDAYQGILSYEDVLSLDKSAITDAGYTEFDGVNCIYVRYISGELGYESLCYISVDTGLMMGEETYDGDTLIYSMVSSVPDISTPDDDVFSVARIRAVGEP